MGNNLSSPPPISGNSVHSHRSTPSNQEPTDSTPANTSHQPSSNHASVSSPHINTNHQPSSILQNTYYNPPIPYQMFPTYNPPFHPAVYQQVLSDLLHNYTHPQQTSPNHTLNIYSHPQQLSSVHNNYTTQPQPLPTALSLTTPVADETSTDTLALVQNNVNPTSVDINTLPIGNITVGNIFTTTDDVSLAVNLYHN